MLRHPSRRPWLLAGLLASGACTAFADGESYLGTGAGAGAGGGTVIQGGYGGAVTSTGSGAGGASATGGAGVGGVNGGGFGPGGQGGGGTTSTTSEGGGGGGAGCPPGYECVPMAPADWSGPTAFYEGDSAIAAPACDPGWGAPPIDAFDQVDGAWDCSACECGAPNASCTLNLTLWATPQCTGAHVVYWASFSGGTCTNINGGFHSVEGKPDVPITCDASGGLPIHQAQPTWGQRARLCTGSTGPACGAGLVCAPTLVSGFHSNTCIHQTGNAVCPNDWPVRKVVYASFADKRGCAPCSCDATPLSCSILVYSAKYCDQQGGQVDAIPADDTCADTPFTAVSVGASKDPKGACTPSSAQPAGGLEPTEPTTICCP